jgi:beta-galactosidase
LPAGRTLPPIPDPIPSIDIPEFAMTPFTSLWDRLPAPIASVHPRPFEMYGQNQGLVLYRTTLVGRKSGRLQLTDLRDYALVFVDGKHIGTLDRRLGEKTIEIPASTNPSPVLDVLVEGMGHINFAQEIIDRKGITDRATLAGMTLMNWQVYLLPLSDTWIGALRGSAPTPATIKPTGPGPSTALRPGRFFRGSFSLDRPADTFIDMTGYRKGYVWVNGHNLGRYWDIGPQTRLYCPAPFLKAGQNEVLVLDLHMTEAKSLRGRATLKDK